MKRSVISQSTVAFLILVLALAMAECRAAEPYRPVQPDPVLEPWRWTIFDPSSGLAGRVFDVFEDREGNIWFATDRGAQRYDGYHWMAYTTEDGLASDKVRTVFQTRDGAMWFGLTDFTTGLRSGIVRYDVRGNPEASTWRLYTEADGLEAGFWPKILQTHDGAIWAISGHAYRGVNRFDGNAWTSFRLTDLGGNDMSRSLLETADGTLWIGSTTLPFTVPPAAYFSVRDPSRYGQGKFVRQEEEALRPPFSTNLLDAV